MKNSLPLAFALVCSLLSSSSFAQNSRSYRTNDHVQVLGGASFVSAGIYLNPQALINVTYTYSPTELALTSYGTKPYEYLEIIEGNLDLFFGNSFYLTLGAGERHLGYTGPEYLGRRPASQAGSVRDTTYTDYVVHSGIGNRWMYKNFVYGFEWLGLVIPASTPDIERNYKGGDPEADKTREEERRRELTKGNFTGKIYIGFSI